MQHCTEIAPRTHRHTRARDAHAPHARTHAHIHSATHKHPLAFMYTRAEARPSRPTRTSRPGARTIVAGNRSPTRSCSPAKRSSRAQSWPQEACIRITECGETAGCLRLSSSSWASTAPGLTVTPGPGPLTVTGNPGPHRIASSALNSKSALRLGKACEKSGCQHRHVRGSLS